MLTLITILGFIFMLGILIAIHEFGHFIVAKMFGVRVELFSIGFLGEIFGFRWGETYYKLAWIPLGGFVKMLGEDGDLEIPYELRHRALNYKPLWQRSLIVLAGPMANLLILPLLTYFILFSTYKLEYSTVIGTILPDMPAAKAGLQPGDRIEAVEGTPTRYFRDLLRLIGHSDKTQLTLTIRRGKHLFKTSLQPKIIETKDFFGDKKTRKIIGIYGDYRKAQVGISDPHSPAYKAGLRTGDLIVAIDGRKIERWEDVLQIRRKAPLKIHRYEIQRHSKTSSPPKIQRLTFNLKALPQKKGSSFRPYDGLHSSELFVKSVEKNSPLAKAGILPNDRLIELAGKKLRSISDLALFPDKTDRFYTILFERQGKIQRRRFKLFPTIWYDRFHQKHEKITLGIRMWDPYEKGKLIPITNRLSYASRRAWERTWEVATLILRSIKKLFTREISTDNIGSPIMIYQVTKDAIERGWDIFLDRLAMISINLGLINLLPIPLLDGGHLFFFLIEGIIRHPIPRRIKESALLVGLMLLFFVLLLAIKNDLQRLFFP